MFDFVPDGMQQNKFLPILCPSPRSLFAQLGALNPAAGSYSGDTAVSPMRSKLSVTDDLNENILNYE